MTATEIIEEIKRLPKPEQASVIQFAYRLDAERQLSGRELSDLAARMVATSDPAEAASLRPAIIHGFYGKQVHAKDPAPMKTAGCTTGGWMASLRRGGGGE